MLHATNVCDDAGEECSVSLLSGYGERKMRFCTS